MLTPTSLVTLSATLATLAGVSTAIAAGQDHRGAYEVCTTSSYVERAPASRPIGIVWKGDTFRVERPGFATVHHAGKAERWAKGTAVHRDAKAGRTFRWAGWMRVADISRGSCG
jgi:hypothetical protein